MRAAKVLPEVHLEITGKLLGQIAWQVTTTKNI